MIYIGKMICDSNWESLSIPKFKTIQQQKICTGKTPATFYGRIFMMSDKKNSILLR